ncbi:MAG: orotate phosphoribosyltransferase [Candidatus Kapabacteria bacterium]|nr:orotate phosphoribosyltransferase [Candidatus Kapabacteria bacterium]
MERNELAKKIYETAHLTGHFVLRSGQVSNEYFDKYRFESVPSLLEAIAEHLAELLPNDFDALAGLEMGGIPLATALSMKTGKPVVFVRKKAKDYGTCKIAEGYEVSGKRLLIVEDVITSGGQVVISANDLRSIGAEIVGAICVINRQSGGTEALAKAGINLKELFTMSQLKETL